MNTLEINVSPNIIVENAGLFVSPGFGRHGSRRIRSHELIYVRSGTLSIAEESSMFRVSEGEALVLWPDRKHWGTEDYTRELSFYWIHFLLPPTAQKDSSTRQVQQHSYAASPSRMSELFHRYIADQEAGNLTREQGKLMLCLMLLELRSDKASPTENTLAAQAERFIATHFRNGIRARDVASNVSCNLDYLGRVYRRVYGRTITSAIHRHQINDACTLLRDDSRSLEEIALAVGFRETRNFRKVFQMVQGISPREYRKLYTRVYINSR